MKKLTSLQHPRVKTWKKLHRRKYREETGQFLVEGPHLVGTAVAAGVPIAVLVVREGDQGGIRREWLAAAEEKFVVSESIMRNLSETKTPQGVAAVCRKKELHSVRPKTGGKYLFIDRVQDPGNVGTMIRTADAVGLDAVIVGEGSADIYSSKVIRATQGSLFHVPVVKGVLASWAEEMKNRAIPLYGSDVRHAVPYKKVSPPSSFALIVGNEGSGVDRSLLAMTDERLLIPIRGKAESFNVAVACGILLAHLVYD